MAFSDIDICEAMAQDIMRGPRVRRESAVDMHTFRESPYRRERRLKRNPSPSEKLTGNLANEDLSIRWIVEPVLMKGISVREAVTITGFEYPDVFFIYHSLAKPIYCECGKDSNHRGRCEARISRNIRHYYSHRRDA